MMPLYQCISIGPIDSEALSFQEVTENTQRRHICILQPHLGVYLSNVNSIDTYKTDKYKTMATPL